MKPVSDLSADELRREIAERLGWRVELRKLNHSGDRRWLVLIRPDGTIYTTEGDQHLPRHFPNDPNAEHDLFEWCPDWPRDAGAALALCLEIGARHDWELVMISVNEVSSAQFVNATDYAVHGETADTPALALARLALAALRAQRDEDETST